jgi:hypothetical protein
LSCRLWGIDARRETPTSGDLRAWADRIAQRVTGLLESLRVLEVDTTRDQALLRSDTPAARSVGVHYYEVALNGTNAVNLQRFQGYPNSAEKRTQLAFVVTHETLAKLLEDLTAES